MTWTPPDTHCPACGGGIGLDDWGHRCGPCPHCHTMLTTARTYVRDPLTQVDRVHPSLMRQSSVYRRDSVCRCCGHAYHVKHHLIVGECPMCGEQTMRERLDAGVVYDPCTGDYSPLDGAGGSCVEPCSSAGERCTDTLVRGPWYMVETTYLAGVGCDIDDICEVQS